MKRVDLLYGAIGAVAASAAAGVATERYLVRRRRPDTPTRFDDLEPDCVRTVRTEDGVALHVEEVGPVGAPLSVVYVHGFTLSLRSFYYERRALSEMFGDDVRQVFYDQRGHGRSGPSVPASATIDQLGRDLYTILDAAVRRGPIVLIAHSMGGMSAMALAAAHPELFSGPRARVVGVALIATSAGQMDGVTFGLPTVVGRLGAPLAPLLLRGARRRPALVERGRRAGADVAWLFTRRLSFGDPTITPATVDFLNDLISRTRIEAIADFYPALMTHDGRDGLAALRTTDVVIIAGEKDVMTPLEHSIRISEALPDAELIVVPRTGHVVMLERPELVDAALGDLVGRALDTSTQSAGDAARRG